MLQGHTRNLSGIARILFAVGAATLVLAILFLGLVQTSRAAEEDVTPADLSGSTLDVDPAGQVPGGSVGFTLVISNAGGNVSETVEVFVTNILPDGLSLLPETFASSSEESSFGVADQSLTWTGTISGEKAVTLTFAAMLGEDVAPGTVLTDVAEIAYAGETLTRTAAIEVIEAEPTDEAVVEVVNNGGTISYIPFVQVALPAPVLNSTRPNSANSWTVSWNAITGATRYEIQEAQMIDFSDAVTTDLGSATAHPVSKVASGHNSYYYRARAANTFQIGPWSAPIEVVGAYRDDFTANTTNWAVRRTTYLEEVTSFYEIDPTRDWMILRVEDSWDWGIASPLKKAPQPPYVIEYRMMPANLGNLVSQGIAFGGDWNGLPCPDYSTFAGVYQHDICFNNFYATNTIWFGKLKIVFERIDTLAWCPSCGGSPMKRLGDNVLNESIRNFTNPNSWNDWRIEVRSTGIDLFVNGTKFMTYADTRYINNPYFGIFATTDEYSNSTARFEYISVTPLDS